MKRMSRKSEVAKRYGWSERTVDRKSHDPKDPFPAPKYFPDGKFPYWDDDKLDKYDATRTERAEAAA